MPPFAMPNETEISQRDGTVTVDSTRRRRTHSKDVDSRRAFKHDRPSILPLNQPRSPTKNRMFRRRKTRSNITGFQTLCIYVFDFLILAYLFRNIRGYFRPTVSQEMAPSQPSTPNAQDIDQVRLSSEPFAKHLDGTPACDDLQPDEVTFSLAVQLSENRLWMMQHHCELWGASALISVAIWTSIGKDEIVEKLKGMGCDPDFVHVQTLPSKDDSAINFPINQLRNMALRGVTTSHVLLLDVDFWESVDLFDTLNLPSVRKALSQDSKLGMVIPAFEAQDLNCGTSSNCRSQQLDIVPRDFEDLVIGLGANRTLPYDPTYFAHQGSTNYRQWMRQNRGELLDISCVSSNQYQPYVVVRRCNDLPPFQEKFSGYGRNHMEWMLHLRRLGYRLQQIGGSFVTHFPHLSSPAKLEWKNAPLRDGEIDLTRHLRGWTDNSFVEFSNWLEANVPDYSRLGRCEGFGDDEEDPLLVVET